MDDIDPELERLKKGERRAHALYERLRKTALLTDPVFAQKAALLWREAVEALHAYQSRITTSSNPDAFRQAQAAGAE